MTVNPLKRRKTVDQVLSGFTKTLQDLDVLAEEAAHERERVEGEISRLRDKSDDLDREQSRARSVHSKLAALIGE